MTDLAETGDSSKESGGLPLSQLPRALINRKWWWTTILVIVGLVILLRLGLWQLDRLEQRRARNAELIEQLAAPPLSLNHFEIPAELSSIRDMQATVQGRFDYARQVILTQQNWRGAPGAHLIAPFLIDDREDAVLVDRGWIPSNALLSADLSQFNDREVQEITGTIRLTQSTPDRGTEPEESQRLEWYRVDIEAIEKQLPYELLPVYILQAPEGEPDELPYQIESEIDLSDGPHLGYAIQWFIFAALLGVGYLRFVMLRGGG